ncbi:hypothetical protein [Pelagicoccus sp. SDUM812003]|uniref:hypothetical protein n=1 Tax=Pelagicoccus sp. SDUM812003 TaxID=3041267 RepID=UPI00280CD1E0|nr:hypothetical protein [Pelagicoccus sp. SDUM812003]MDQ8201566.1 hypothetical protein [Pelagicoccus sp. SDUM812003]
MDTLFKPGEDYVTFRERARGLMQMHPGEIDMLERCLGDGKSYLELGAGFSTVFFAAKVERMVSVETRDAWWESVQSCLNRFKLDHVDLRLAPPEPIAYDALGRETWYQRSDYGTAEEFSGYLSVVRALVEKGDFDTVLVDGNVRCEVVLMLREMNFSGRTLIHDVMPSRQHLNALALSNPRIRVREQADTLCELVWQD